MLFGGWAKEDEELCDQLFQGDWNMFWKWRDEQRAKIVYTPIPKETINGTLLYAGDIICESIDSNGNAINSFYIRSFNDTRQPVGVYITDSGDHEETIFKSTTFHKICSTTSNL